MKFRSVISNNRGMTLVELLVASAIMGVVALAVSNLYISTQRTTTSSLEISDVQANLRVAIDRIAEDVRMAGFLVDDDPIDSTSAADSLTINTASLGRHYARVTAPVTAAIGTNVFTVVSNEMAERFSAGGKVRIIRPSLFAEPEGNVFDVVSTAGSSISLSGMTSGTQFLAGDVIVPAGPNLLRTVNYSISGNTLVRTIDGTSQLLARNISNITFNYFTTSGGVINSVEIILTGTTGNLPSGVKQRTLRTRASVRNI